MKSLGKTFIIVFSTILLTGCFGSGDSTEQTGETPENFIKYDSQRFSVALPQSWKTIEPMDFIDDVPSETLVIFRDNIRDDLFTPNANITKRLLDKPMSSYNFARVIINENQSTLLNYREIIRDEEFNIVIGDQLVQTVLIMFAGKESETEPTIRIIQAYGVNANEAYTVTAAYLENTDELASEEAKNIVKSFKLK